MTPKISHLTAVAGAALLLAVPAAWGKGQLPTTVSPDAMHEDGFDQAVAKSVALWMAEDGFDRAVAAKLAQQSKPITSPDAVDRYNAATLAQRSSGSFAMDDRLREPVDVPVSTSATSSGSGIEWPQIGLGFGVGILLALGIGLAMRLTRIRPLAHG